MKPQKYDLIVIGSGAGAKLARPAAQNGQHVAIIEKDKLGGTCLNRGCIPSKMLIHPADVALEIQEAKKFFIDSKYIKVDFSKLTHHINKITDGDSNSIKRWYESKRIKGLDLYSGTAHFVEDKVLEVNGKRITADKIVIAVGARPFVPPINGLDKTPYMTSTEALRNRTLPKKLVVIGGGYIGCELGHAYSALGSEVTYITKGYFLGRIDSELKETFNKVFSKRFKDYESEYINEIEFKKNKFHIHMAKGKKKHTLSSDQLLVATGVKPNTDLLKLENTKIKTKGCGFIKVNKNLESSVPGVFALGDCAGNYMFRHSANFEAEHIFDFIVHGKKKKEIKYPAMPWSVFTNPQVAGVGPTEDELIEKKVQYIKGVNHYSESAMGQALREEDGFVKLIFKKSNKELIAAHIIGPEASTLIHLATIHMSYGAKLDDLLGQKNIYVHPALPEVFRNAARKAEKQFNVN